MKRNRVSVLLSLFVVADMWLVLPSMAQSQATPTQYQKTKATFVHLGNGVPGVLYEPTTPGTKAAIGVYVMHSAGDYLQFSACTELSQRGYRVLCANSTVSKTGTETDQNIDRLLLDAKVGVAWLRKNPAIHKVVLFGHSGGGVLMSSYQAVAEGGLKACQGPEKILKCSDSVAGLPAADGVILVDANYGTSAMTLFSMDPAVIDEASGMKVDPKLNLWDPQNGFTPTGARYTEDFTHRFQKAIATRETRLISTALDRLQKINAGQGLFNDDEPFVVPGASNNINNNKFFTQDPRFLSHTNKPWPLIHKDGSITTEIVHTVRVPEGLQPTTSSYGASLRTTVRKFLGTYALRVNDDFAFDESTIRGVDWASSYTTPISSVRNIKVPLLTMGMTGHFEFLNAEFIYENSTSADKSIAFIEGANHEFTTCVKCEKTPGQYGDTVKTLYNYIDGWLSKSGRFIK